MTSSRIRHLVEYVAVISSNVQSTWPTVVPRWLRDDPTRPHKAQRWPQDGLKRPHRSPKRPQDGPQDGPKRSQDVCWTIHFGATSSRIRHLVEYVAVISNNVQSTRPTVVPRWLRDDPTRPHKAQRWPPDGLKRPHRSPKRPQDGHKRLQDGPQDGPKRPQEAPRWSKSASRGHNMVPRWLQEAPRWP